MGLPCYLRLARKADKLAHGPDNDVKHEHATGFTILIGPGCLRGFPKVTLWQALDRKHDHVCMLLPIGL